MSFDEIWTVLEAPRQGEMDDAGVTVRRIDPAAPDSLFVGFRRSSGTRMLLLQSLVAPRPSDGPLIQSRGFTTTVNRFTGDTSHFHVVIEAAAPSFNQVFGCLASDIAECLFRRPASSNPVAVFLGRLLRWKRFFDSGGGQILSEIEVQGILAELLFLRDFVIPECQSQSSAVSSWAIPEPLSKDFQYSSGAVEVKCSASREHTLVHINGERQLDDAGFPCFYLLAVLLERVIEGGFTLPETINSVRHVLNDEVARAFFEDKLLNYGYLDIDAPQYSQRYLLHRMRTFRIQDGFPRVPPVLPNGVGDLNYTVALSACTSFEVDLDCLRTLIRESQQ